MIVVLDIDGTLADSAHRQKYVDQPDKFYSPDLVFKDGIVPGAAEAISEFQRLNYTIYFVTARGEYLRDATMRWLLEKFDLAPGEGQLIMRPHGNLLNAAEYKREAVMTARLELDRTQGFLLVDDDTAVCTEYAAFGTVLKAPECWKVTFPKQAQA